jgi:DNA-binding IclR family transcriptional regulator
MYVIQSIERAFDILRALATGPGRISELAVAVDLPKSTVARMLFTLERVGAVTRVPGTNQFRIGDGLRELAPPLDSTERLTVAVMPHLHQLSEAIGEAAGFSVPEGYAMHYLVQVDSPRPIQVRDYSGSSAAMHLVPAGLCVMAGWPDAELDRYLSRPLERNTPHSVVEPEAIRRRLVGIRSAGYAWIHEEFAEGLSSVAAPVLDANELVIGAITVHGPSYRFPPEGQRDRIGAAARAAANRFSLHRLAS